MFIATTLRKKNRISRGAIAEEMVVSLWILFLFLFFPLIDYATMGLRAFFLWFSCSQAAVAGAKGTVWSTNSYSGNYYTCIQTQATTTANQYVKMFSGITVTSGPTLTVYPQPITNTNAPALSTYTPTVGKYLDKSLYVPILQVSMTGSIQPFIVIPFLPAGVPGLNAPFSMTVVSAQQIENIDALAY